MTGQGDRQMDREELMNSCIGDPKMALTRGDVFNFSVTASK